MAVSKLPQNTEAIRIHEFGGVEVLRLESVPVSPPGPGPQAASLSVCWVW